MTREIESENTILADKVMKKIVSIKSHYYTIQKNFRSDVVTKHLHTVQNTLNATTFVGIANTFTVNVGIQTGGGTVSPAQLELIMSVLETSTV